MLCTFKCIVIVGVSDPPLGAVVILIVAFVVQFCFWCFFFSFDRTFSWTKQNHCFKILYYIENLYHINMESILRMCVVYVFGWYRMTEFLPICNYNTNSTVFFSSSLEYILVPQDRQEKLCWQNKRSLNHYIEIKIIQILYSIIQNIVSSVLP